MSIQFVVHDGVDDKINCSHSLHSKYYHEESKVAFNCDRLHTAHESELLRG